MMADDVIEMTYRRERLLRALAKLDSDYKRLAVILYLLSYRQHEIAEVYGCSPQNIQQIVREFKRRNGLRREPVEDRGPKLRPEPVEGGEQAGLPGLGDED